MTNLWKQQEKENARQYTAFCDYRDMGTERSLRGLAEQYIKRASNPDQTKPPTVKESTIFTWSVRKEWKRRVVAWDDEQTAQRTKQFEIARQQIIDDELRDYNLQLDKWIEAYKRTPLHERQHRVKNEDGSITEFIGLNHDDLHRMAKWRDEITKQGRRALGMPSKVTKKHIDLGKEGRVKFIIQYENRFPEDDNDSTTNNPPPPPPIPEMDS